VGWEERTHTRCGRTDHPSWRHRSVAVPGPDWYHH